MSKKYLFVILLFLSGCKGDIEDYIENMEDDGLAEEVVEEVIKYYTGETIDLTPESPEQD